MLKHKPVLLALSLALGLASLPLAQATSLGGTFAVDDGVYLYLSTNNSTLGTPIGNIPESKSWSVTQTLTLVTLNPGTTYYLQAEVINGGGTGGFLGQFTLSDTGATFANGTQTLLTGSTDWTGGYNATDPSYSSLSWVTPTGTVMNEQANVAGAYWPATFDSPHAGISSTAQWIWPTDPNSMSTANDPSTACQYCMVDMYTTITVASAASTGSSSASVPGPATAGLLLASLIGLWFLDNRRRRIFLSADKSGYNS